MDESDDIIDESVVDVDVEEDSSVFFELQAAARETIVITNKADFRIRFIV
jgi:hypothetical protein